MYIEGQCTFRVCYKIEFQIEFQPAQGRCSSENSPMMANRAAFRQPGDSALASMSGWGAPSPPTPPPLFVGLWASLIEKKRGPKRVDNWPRRTPGKVFVICLGDFALNKYDCNIC